MPFKWEKDYLELAKFLKDEACQKQNEEACLRSSVSRAYYAAVNYAFQVTKAKGLYEGQPDRLEHRLVREAMGKFRPDWKRTMSGLQQSREDCDYKDGLEYDLCLKAQEAIKTANKIIKYLEGMT